MDLDPDKAVDAPPLAGRVKLAKGIEEGVDPPEELEQGVLLKGRVHSIYAASGAGKTWVVLWLVKRCLERGEKVVFFDAENGHRIVSERLIALGVETKRLDELLHYYPFPNLTLDPEHVASYKTLLDELKPALVIFDSLVNFLGSAGLEENSNDDIVKWATRYTRPARERDVTVVVLDHVPHESGHARGASRKKDEVDVMWALTNPMPFDRDTVGRIVLKREKDREGWLGERVGFSVGGTAGGFVFRHSQGTIEEPDAADGLTGSQRTALEALQGFQGTGATAGQWHKQTGQGTSTFYRARDVLMGRELAFKEGSRYFPTPEPGDDDGGSSKTRTGKRDTGYSHSLPKHSHGSNGSGAVVTPITPTTLEGGSNGSTAGTVGDFAASASGESRQQGSEEKGGREVDPGGVKPAFGAGGSAPGLAEGGNDVARRNEASRRLTAEEAERVKRLVAEGMSHAFARAEVLAKGHPQDCACEVCL